MSKLDNELLPNLADRVKVSYLMDIMRMDSPLTYLKLNQIKGEVSKTLAKTTYALLVLML